MLVTACDKLHNARAIVADLERIGPRVFDRFTAGQGGTLWYYSQTLAALRAGQCPVADALAVAVTRMRQLCEARGDQEAAAALVASLTPRQRGELRQLIGSFEASAKTALTEGARALGSASDCQQRLVTLLQLFNVDNELPVSTGQLSP